VPEPPVPRVQFHVSMQWTMLQVKVPGKQLRDLPMESGREIVPGIRSSTEKKIL